MDITESLKAIIKGSPTAPFLFIGSGFSRRYLGLEDWEGLLTRFGNNLKTGFVKYASESNDDLALAAQNMAREYSEYWWSLPQAQEISKSPNWYKHLTSPLRYDVCEYLTDVSLESKLLEEELKILIDDKTVIDGVITTNWDLLLENLFPTYTVYIGQSDLLFSNPQKIAEIYKIHGCSSDPKSLVLTKEDYEDFKNKNAYLASKLLSIFLEHPVFFIGYSLNDENIASILGSISEIMTTDDQREKIAKNLIFVNRAKGDTDSISQTQLRFLDNKSIPITQVKTDDFSKVYLAFQDKERKIPAHILRVFREQFYQIVQGESPEKKLYCATNVDEIMDGKSNIEFVAGFGLSRGKIGEIGLQGIEIESLIKDIIFDDIEFEADEILRRTFPKIINKGKYIPIKKYQNKSGLSVQELEDLGLKKLMQRSKKDYLKFINNTYHRTYQNQRFKSLDDIINSDLSDTTKFEVIGWYLLKKPIDLAKISEYLKSNFKKSNKNSSFKKLVCIYDLIKYS